MDVLVPSADYEAEMIAAFRRNPQNLPFLEGDWIGKGFSWSAGGVEVTLAPCDYRRERLTPPSVLPATLDPNGAILFEDLRYMDLNAFGNLFDGYDTGFTDLYLPRVSCWEIVSVAGGTLYAASKDIKGTPGVFPHAYAGDIVIRENEIIEAGTFIGLQGLQASGAAPSGTGVAAINTHGLKRQMLRSVSGTVLTKWSVKYKNAAEQVGTYNITTASVTLWDVTGVSPSDVGNVLSFSILPTNGNLLAQQCGAADGTGGGTVSGNSVDVIVSGATGVFS